MNLLSRFKISSKLAGMLALSALAVCANIALSTSLSQKRMLDDRVTQLRTAVDHMEVRRFILNGATRAQDHSAVNRDLLCYHISGINPTQVCRATGPIFAAHPAYRFSASSSSIGTHR